MQATRGAGGLRPVRSESDIRRCVRSKTSQRSLLEGGSRDGVGNGLEEKENAFDGPDRRLGRRRIYRWTGWRSLWNGNGDFSGPRHLDCRGNLDQRADRLNRLRSSCAPRGAALLRLHEHSST